MKYLISNETKNYNGICDGQSVGSVPSLQFSVISLEVGWQLELSWL